MNINLKIVIVILLSVINVVFCGDGEYFSQHMKKNIEIIHAKEDVCVDNKKHEFVRANLYGNNTLNIDLSRLNDNIYGVEQINNRWSLEEIDVILNSIKGIWKISNYIGFIPYKLYEPGLFGISEVNDKTKKMIDKYDKAVEKSKNRAFDFLIYIRSFDNSFTAQNSVVVKNENAIFESPISIILSMDKNQENYPVFSDQTSLSQDFLVKYPVIFIKFFLKDNTNNYLPATILLSSDNKSYILIDGAFYELKRVTLD